VLHVVPQDLARGAQVHARELRRRLDGRGARHRLTLLFGVERSVTQADCSLGAPSGLGRRAGFSPSAFLRLVAHVLRERPDVVVAHGGESMKYVGLLPTRAAKIYHRIGGPPGESRRGSKTLYSLLGRRFDRLVGVGTEITEHAGRQLQVPPERTVVIHNGRDPEEFRPSDRSCDGPVRALFVGHLVEGKRPTVFPALVRSMPPGTVTGSIVGDGPLAGELRRSYPEVSLLGRRSDVADVMRRHDVLIFTSQPPEGLPGVLVEAALCGLPILATAVPGADEVVEHGVTGYLVPPSEPGELATYLQELVDNPGRRHQMGEAARARAVERFSIHLCVDRWDHLIHQVRFGEHRGAGPCG
jgi:glycosyltransferase involved in cell wall biosynthesis